MKSFRFFSSLLALGVALAGLGTARATPYQIEINTSALVGNAAGPFYLDFQSIWGSGSDQTITLSDFVLTGGGFIPGTADFVGAVAGDVATSLVLSPNSGSVWNEFWQQFDGTVSKIKFVADISNNVSGATPTSFSVSILDATDLYPIETDGLGDTLVMFDINGRATSYVTSTSVGNIPGVTATVPDTGATAVLVLAAIGGLLAAHGVRRRWIGAIA